VCTLLKGGHHGTSEGQLFLEFGRNWAALCNAFSGVGQRSVELGENADTLFEYGQLVDGQRRAGGNVRPDKRGQVGGRPNSALRGSLIEGASVSRPEPYGDPIRRRLPPQWRTHPTDCRAIRLQYRAYSDQGQGGFRDATTVG